MIMRKLSLILLFTLISTLSLFAKAKVLIVSGTGATENEAIENAISEAMTHGYMSFINSKEETKDEDIQTSEEVTSFNPDIKLTGYNLLSSEKTNNGYNVKVEVQFKKTPFLAQTYGKMFSTAGKMFAQSIGISTKEKQKTPQEEVLERIRTKNELAVHEALKNALALRLDNLFDYKVKVGEGANGKVPVEISVIQNKNTKAFCRLLYQTLYFSSHSAFNFDVKDGTIVHDGYAFPYAKGMALHFYNDDAKTFGEVIKTYLTAGIFGFKIKDDLGHEFYFTVNKETQLQNHGNIALTNYSIPAGFDNTPKNVSESYQSPGGLGMFGVKTKPYYNGPVKAFGGNDGLPNQVGLAGTTFVMNSIASAKLQSSTLYEINLELSYSPEDYQKLQGNFSVETFTPEVKF